MRSRIAMRSTRCRDPKRPASLQGHCACKVERLPHRDQLLRHAYIPSGENWEIPGGLRNWLSALPPCRGPKRESLRKRSKLLRQRLSYRLTAAAMLTAATLGAGVGLAPSALATQTTPAPPVQPAEVQPDHVISCNFWTDLPLLTNNQVEATGVRSCNGESDIDYMEVALQRWNGDYWQDWVMVNSSSVQATLVLTAAEGCPTSGYFRTRLHDEGFHGTWTETNFSSDWVWLEC